MSLFEGSALGQGSARRNQGDLDVEIDMVPVMNMFLVLIPFLLMSSNFLHLKAINTSVPVKAATSIVVDKKVSDIEITAIVEIKSKSIKLSASAEKLSEAELKKFDVTFATSKAGSDEKTNGGTPYPLADLSLVLQEIKAKYPKSNTVILIPGESILYDTIVKTMDAARRLNDEMLFPNVVLSGAVSSIEAGKRNSNLS